MTIEKQFVQDLFNLQLSDGRIIGSGVDILEPERVGKDVEDNPLFAEEFCSPEEISFCDLVTDEERRKRYARKFSLKEAVIKALGGSGDTGEELELDWREIICAEDGINLPSINLIGRAKKRADEQGITSLSAFFSEIRNMPVVFCIAQGRSY